MSDEAERMVIAVARAMFFENMKPDANKERYENSWLATRFGYEKLARVAIETLKGEAECSAQHPRLGRVRCTQPAGHDHQHVSFDYPSAGQWSA